MKNIIRAYFYYNRSERNGFFILALICVLGFLTPAIYRQFSNKPISEFDQFKSEVAIFESALNSKTENEKYTINKLNEDKFERFTFDPNTISESDLQRLGLKPKVIKTLLNFRSKGGKFFKPKDIQKIYGLSEADYDRLKDLIQIPKTDFAKQNKNKKTQKSASTEKVLFSFDPNTATQSELEKLGFPKRATNNLIKFRNKGGVIRKREELAKIYGIDEAFFEKLFPYISIEIEPKVDNKVVDEIPKSPEKDEPKITIDINQASAEEWQKIRGIGLAFSNRIVKFRDRLGGFYAISQVAETYGLPDSVFQKIRPILNRNTPHNRLNVNTVSVENLTSHPYLRKKQAEVIINYRSQHGNFQSIEDLNKIRALSPELIQKIKPYLSFE